MCAPSPRPPAEPLPACRLSSPRAPPSHLPTRAHLDPATYAHLATRQGASAFNQLVSFDTSSVTNMYAMFAVRTLAPTTPAEPLPVHAA